MFKHTLLLAALLNPLIVTANAVSVREIKQTKQPMMTRIAKGGAGLLSLGLGYFPAKTLMELIEHTSILKYDEQPFRSISLLTSATAFLTTIGISALAHSFKGSSMNITAHAFPLITIGVGTSISVISHNSLQNILSKENKNFSYLSLAPLFIILESSGMQLTAQGALDIKKAYAKIEDREIDFYLNFLPCF